MNIMFDPAEMDPKRREIVMLLLSEDLYERMTTGRARVEANPLALAERDFLHRQLREYTTKGGAA